MVFAFVLILVAMVFAFVLILVAVVFAFFLVLVAVVFAFFLVFVAVVIVLGVSQALREGTQGHVVCQLEDVALGAALKILLDRTQLGADDHEQVRLRCLADVAR